MQSSSFPSLRGPNAFYNSPSYEADTRRDFACAKPLPASYIVTTESKIARIVKQVLSVIVFPIGLYRCVHALIGKMIVPASMSMLGIENRIEEIRRFLSSHGCARALGNNWIVKRLTVEVDGRPIEAAILGKEETIGNGRWVLPSLGNGQFFEEELLDEQYSLYRDRNGHSRQANYVKAVLSHVHGNALLFNYPGVPGGWPNRQTIVKVYRAMLTVLEDQNNGIGAREIIGLGHSLGGAVQGEALQGRPYKDGIKYVFVKSRTFSNLAAEASFVFGKSIAVLGKIVGLAIRLFGWNMSSVESSKALAVPEIIMQTSSEVEMNMAGRVVYDDNLSSSAIINDGVIGADASLAKALLEDPDCPKVHKVFFGIAEHHNEGIWSPDVLAEKIEEGLRV